MVSEEEIDAYARMLVFVPYRGFYFLNNYIFTQEFSKEILFSSPIGAFIFLIGLNWDCINLYDGLVFVPYRGFYFLNPGLTILVFMRVKKMFCGVNLF